MDSAHQNRLHAYRRTSLLAFRKLAGITHFSSPRNENAKNDARSSEIKISFGSEGGIDQSWRGKIIGAATLA
jgi:hypothetical protein